MSPHAAILDDPNFTGAASTSENHEQMKLTFNARIEIKRVDNYNNGKVIRTYYKWAVYAHGVQITNSDFFSDIPKTRKTAIACARRAARAYAELANPKHNYL